MISVIQDEFTLSHSSGHGCFGSASMFIACKDKGAHHIHVGIHTLRPEPLSDQARMEAPWANPTHTYKSSYLKLREGTALTRSLQQMYLPGGFHIEFIERQNEWLIIFKAELILASAYMYMSKEEMSKLLLSIDRSICTRER